MSKLKLYIISANMLLVLGFFFFNIIKNESILNDGETVLLELRPVDPRSIMQGDYMALRFSLGDEVRRGEERFPNVVAEEFATDSIAVDVDITAVNDEDTTAVNNGDEIVEVVEDDSVTVEENDNEDIAVAVAEENPYQDYNVYKYCVVRLDKDRVAHYVRLTNSADDLQKNEILLRYETGKSTWEKYVYFGSDSYFFQEGTGDKYAHARYGMFKVATKGGLIGTCNLVGLCGEDKQLIK